MLATLSVRTVVLPVRKEVTVPRSGCIGPCGEIRARFHSDGRGSDSRGHVRRRAEHSVFWVPHFESGETGCLELFQQGISGRHLGSWLRKGRLRGCSAILSATGCSINRSDPRASENRGRRPPSGQVGKPSSRRRQRIYAAFSKRRWAPAEPGAAFRAARLVVRTQIRTVRLDYHSIGCTLTIFSGGA